MLTLRAYTPAWGNRTLVTCTALMQGLDSSADGKALQDNANEAWSSRKSPESWSGSSDRFTWLVSTDHFKSSKFTHLSWWEPGLNEFMALTWKPRFIALYAKSSYFVIFIFCHESLLLCLSLGFAQIYPWCQVLKRACQLWILLHHYIRCCLNVFHFLKNRAFGQNRILNIGNITLPV